MGGREGTGGEAEAAAGQGEGGEGEGERYGQTGRNRRASSRHI